MRINNRTRILIASLAAVVCMCGVAYAALPLFPGGEQVNIRITKLLQRMTNAGKGTIMIATSRDDWEPLAVTTHDGYTLQFDTATGLPLWADPAVPPTDPVLTDHGGTGLSSYTQGDMVYYTSSTAFSKLAKSAATGFAIRDTGASNAPAWGPVETVIYESLTPPVQTTGATTTEVEQTPVSGEGSQTLVVERMNKLGAIYHIHAFLTFTSDSDSGEKLKVKLYVGGLSGKVLIDTGDLAIDGTTVTGSPFLIDGTLKTLTTGATGTMLFTGSYSYKVGTATPVTVPVTASTGSIDLTATKKVSVSTTFTGTDAADTNGLIDLGILGNNYD